MQRACNTCGTGYTPRWPGQRQCPACEPYGRDSRSPTTQAQDATYRRNRAAILHGNPPCALRIHCDGDPATTVDHVTPVAHGGTNNLANLQPACPRCNAAKQARTTACQRILTPPPRQSHATPTTTATKHTPLRLT